MPVVAVIIHPRGLHPLQAAKAWHLHKEEGLPLTSVREEVQNTMGLRPSAKAVWTAVRAVEQSQGGDGVPRSGYSNFGRRPTLTDEQQKAIVAFVRAWRNKRVCTCSYIRTALRLKVTTRTIAHVLNRYGFFWRQIPKVRGFSGEQLRQRKEFVDEHVGKPPGWWQDHMNLVIDGVTFTKAPKPLDKRQLHMAQAIKSMWMQEGEQQETDCQHYNRYGVQLGVKVPLWGGFTGRGRFALRLWTPRPKMSKEEWPGWVPRLKRAADAGGDARRNVRAKVWQDGEKFLQQSDVYKRHGLILARFPLNSGDLNPIETVWAWLRRDLARREQEDFTANREITVAQFRQRCAQILKTYEERRPGQEWSRLEKLVRGMPRRLAKCKARRYGRCGK